VTSDFVGRRQKALLTFAFCLLPFALAGSQSQSPPTFRTGVEVVQVDITVLDKNRRPVRGLTAADFQIFENGKPQQIVAFTEVSIPDPEPPAPDAAPWLRDATPDVTSNHLDERRLFMIVMDDATVPADPQILETAKRIGRDVVEKMGPHDIAAVIYTLDNRNSQDFTGDHGKLIAAINRFKANFAFMDGPQDYYFQSSIGTTTRAAELMASIPQRRKALVYVSVGVPVSFADAGPTAIDGKSSMLNQQSALALIDDMKGSFIKAERNNVSIYSYDPGGLGGFENYLINYFSRKASGGAALEAAHSYVKQTHDFLNATSANTGGLATLNTNDFSSGIDQMFRENSSYYIVGFQSDSPKSGGNRALKIGTTRGDLSVRSRTWYDAEKLAKPETRGRKEPTPLGKAIAGVLPNGTLPMRVVAAPFYSGRGDRATIAVTLGVHQPVMSDRASEMVDLQVNAYNTDGKFQDGVRQTAKLLLRANANGEGQYEILSKLELKPGRYQLRLAASTVEQKLAGSVYADVEVPDFSKAPVSLSGFVVATVPAITAAPRDAFVGLLPFAPTTQRMFSETDGVAVFLRVYQGGKSPIAPVAITARVLNARNQRVFARNESIRVDQFKGREADYKFQLPVATLAPGDYIARVDVTLPDGSKAGGDLRFTRR
jgi:VWFA-related protein